VALPSSSIDFSIVEGLQEIEIEQRDGTEIMFVEGQGEEEMQKVRILPNDSPVSNHGFDITPARLVSGFITERGICKAGEKEIMEMFPDMA
jgi:methylthioribose-1-phosphate isomerase